MKSPPLSRPRPNWLHRLIEDVTSEPAKDLARIENIMQDEIFHSTLDWQSREQLGDAARQAFARLDEDRELYDLDHACRMVMFHKMRAESALREQNTPANRSAVVAADVNYQSARTKLLARLDETKPN
jgi:aminoglycoside phosphotransferase (APT) family kinase protein